MSRKALAIALFISLAVNIFVIGAFAGAALTGMRGHGPAWRGHGRPAPMAGGVMGGFGPAAAALAPEHREAWRTAMREQAMAAGPKLREARQVRREAWLGLRSEPMNAQTVLNELERSRVLEAQARADIDRRVVEFAGALPADERGRLAEALVQPRRGPGSGRRGPPGEAETRLPNR